MPDFPQAAGGVCVPAQLDCGQTGDAAASACLVFSWQGQVNYSTENVTVALQEQLVSLFIKIVFETKVGCCVTLVSEKVQVSSFPSKV